MGKKAILLTGVPGTGKTTAAKLAAKVLGAKVIQINQLVESEQLYSRVDSDGAKVVRLGLLKETICQAIKQSSLPAIIEGHLGCEIRLPVQKVIVLRCHPKILRRRLAKRKYSHQKISSNVLSECLDYCTVLSEKNYGRRKVWEIDTTSLSKKQVAQEIVAIFGGKKKGKPVSFPDAFEQEAITSAKLKKLLS
ncbi:MAG: AAA family ATPase [Candidatus Anstonellaceae archaeon]